MNVLFITLTNYHTIKDHDLYTDLLREFMKQGHIVYLMSPAERRYKEMTRLINEGDATILKVKTLNIQKTNIVEKGIGTLLIEPQFKSAIKKYLSGVTFDLILYSTPPITFVNAVKYVKQRDGAKTYLLLKDIFPQNAVDIGMMTKSGLKGILYKFFRKKERLLYRISDRIGCMSQANVKYLLERNDYIDSASVEVAPNAIEVFPYKRLSDTEKNSMRAKYGIPTDKIVFLYGGNLGKPQDIPFVIKCLEKAIAVKNAHFLIVGNGTEYNKLRSFVDEKRPTNVTLLERLPRDDYEMMVYSCDVGLLFLDHRFTIPNYPSRILNYMQAGIPVIACTDMSTDIGQDIVTGNLGWWCESNNTDDFVQCVDSAIHSDLVGMGLNGYNYLLTHFSSKDCFKTVIKLCK